jgi:hypothetical protein
MQHRQQAKIFLSPAGSFVAGKQTVGRAALVGVLSPETIVSQSDLVVTTEGTVGDAATVRVHIQAKQPHLGDVISTEFVLELEALSSQQLRPIGGDPQRHAAGGNAQRRVAPGVARACSCVAGTGWSQFGRR